MKVTISKAEAAKLIASPVPGYIVTDADWSVRKAGDVELTLEPAPPAPIANVVTKLDATTEARR